MRITDNRQTPTVTEETNIVVVKAEIARWMEYLEFREKQIERAREVVYYEGE